MSKSEDKQLQFPKWFTPETVDTVIVAFADVYGRLMGKRLTWEFFHNSVMKSGFHFCNYLMTVDIPMNILPGFKVASWEKCRVHDLDTNKISHLNRSFKYHVFVLKIDNRLFG